jgi:hypothetical protein
VSTSVETLDNLTISRRGCPCRQAAALIFPPGNFVFVVCILSLVPGSLMAATYYYVSPTGSDANSGAFDSPFYSIHKAIPLLVAGDMIYVRGGTYAYTNKIYITTSGNASATNNIWAYQDEKPILDFSGMIDTNTTGKGFEIMGDYWSIRGLEIRYAPDNGMRIRGNHNTIERCVFHHNKNTGLQIGLEGSSINTGNQAGSNTVINCDSYRNADTRKSGGDADGMACKLSAGPGNAFYGCRAWENSDDGWDLFHNQFAVIISNCWTWHSGDASLYPFIPAFDGNGNGFKLGGYNTGSTTSHGVNLIYNCVAFNNQYTTGRGFDQNKHRSGMIVYNCLSFDNLCNYRFPDLPDDGTTNFFKNNVSFAGASADSFVSGTVQQSNSWNIAGITVNSNDFVSVSESLAAAPRNPDGTLPTAFARLVAGSDLIDRGVSVGLPYNGSAPDLGAYEFVAQNPIRIESASMTGTGLDLHVTGLTGHGLVVVQISPDLVSWTPVFTNSPVTGGWQYLDPEATNQAQRFYKMQEQ